MRNEKLIVKTLDAEILESVSNEELETEIEGADEVQEQITIASNYHRRCFEITTHT